MATIALPEPSTTANVRPIAGSASRQLPRLVAGLLFAVVAYVFANVMLSLWLSCTIADGESSILSNVLIEYARTGRWHYPVHAHHLFYPSMTVFMLHPPLHYWLASWWVAWFGVGPWQFAAQSIVTAVLMSGFVALACRRIYGTGTAALTLALAALFYGMHFTAGSLRCDITFGACYTLFLFTLGRVWLFPLRGRTLTLHTFALGLLSIACLAAHWNGYFVQLYLPVIGWLVYRREPARGKINAAVLLGGIVAAFVPWALLYDGNLLQSLVFAVLQGAHFMVLLDIGWTLFLAPFLEWPGGRAVVAGLALLLGDKLWQIIAALRRRDSVAAALSSSFADRCDLFVFFNLAAYLTWWSLFVHNRHPQYLGNFCFLVLPLAARGYARLIDRLTERFLPGTPWKECLAATCGLLLVVTSTQVARTFAAKPTTLRNPQIVYDQARAALQSVVPTDRPIIVGGNAYPYLYDSDYRSTMLLSATPFLKPIESRDFVELLRRHFAQRGSLNAYGMSTEQRRQLLLDHGDVLVTTESGHSWQNCYYPPEVWQADYVEVATVFIHAPDLNGGIEAIHHSPWMRGPKFYTVYMRHDLARRELQRLAADVGRVQVREHAALLIYDPYDKPRPTISAEAWSTFDDERKRREVRKYFDDQAWFGVEFDAATENSLLQQLHPEIEKELATWKTWGRSLGQGIDVALAETGLIRRWQRGPTP